MAQRPACFPPCTRDGLLGAQESFCPRVASLCGCVDLYQSQLCSVHAPRSTNPSSHHSGRGTQQADESTLTRAPRLFQRLVYITRLWSCHVGAAPGRARRHLECPLGAAYVPAVHARRCSGAPGRAARFELGYVRILTCTQRRCCCPCAIVHKSTVRTGRLTLRGGQR
jgi:hypothetical protein